MKVHNKTLKALLTLPNMLTCFRFIAAPVLLWLAWFGYGNEFLWLLAFTFLTDILDGLAARLLNQESELGALLDSSGDLVIYTIMAISIWWLWPEIVHRELIVIVLATLSFITPPLIGLIKFHAFTSYHTWLVKVAVICIGLAFFVLFIFDIVWPFQLATLICILAATEEIAITFYLSELQSNVRSFWHITHQEK